LLPSMKSTTDHGAGVCISAASSEPGNSSTTPLISTCAPNTGASHATAAQPAARMLHPVSAVDAHDGQLVVGVIVADAMPPPRRLLIRVLLGGPPPTRQQACARDTSEVCSRSEGGARGQTDREFWRSGRRCGRACGPTGSARRWAAGRRVPRPTRAWRAPARRPAIRGRPRRRTVSAGRARDPPGSTTAVAPVAAPPAPPARAALSGAGRPCRRGRARRGAARQGVRLADGAVRRAAARVLLRRRRRRRRFRRRRRRRRVPVGVREHQRFHVRLRVVRDLRRASLSTPWLPAIWSGMWPQRTGPRSVMRHTLKWRGTALRHRAPRRPQQSDTMALVRSAGAHRCLWVVVLVLAVLILALVIDPASQMLGRRLCPCQRIQPGNVVRAVVRGGHGRRSDSGGRMR
jgi:hypothetical protein